MVHATYGYLQEVVYVTAGRLIRDFQSHCTEYHIAFDLNTSIRPPEGDHSTLFISAGMQRVKPLFADPTHVGTIANIQRCLRLTDFDEVGDATHCLSFDMMGLFSFRQMPIADAVQFWHRYLKRVGITPDYVTVHPDQEAVWRGYHPREIEVRPDPGCTWSDGGMGGYCTEFFVGDIEIGNIVNPLGTCVDVGFGLQRLMLVLGEPLPDADAVIIEGIQTILDAGYCPGNKNQNYVLRRLLRALWRRGGSMAHPVFAAEKRRQEALQARYERLRHKYPDKDAAWWLDTQGITLD